MNKVKIIYLESIKMWCVYRDRPWGMYKGIEFYNTPEVIAYARTLDEAAEIAKEVKNG